MVEIAEDFDAVVVRAIEEGLSRQFDGQSIRSLQFFLDFHIAASNPERFASSIKRVHGEVGSSLVKSIGDRLLELTGASGRPWGSFGECVEVARDSLAHPFTTRLGIARPLPKGANFLLEADPSALYEKTLSDYIDETASAGRITVAFTTRGGPVYQALSKKKGIKIYSMTGAVSYPKETDGGYEVQIPMNDQAILLDVLDKTFGSPERDRISLVFDSLSKLMIGLGPEVLGKFIMQTIELTSASGAVSVFVLIRGAQDEKTSNFIRSLFSNHLLHDTDGIRATRLSSELTTRAAQGPRQ